MRTSVAGGTPGATLGVQVAYFVGRRHSPRLIAQFPSVALLVQRLEPLVARHSGLALIPLRFADGLLRTAGPAVIGMIGVPRVAFAVFSTIGALRWSALFCGIGWQFGEAPQWSVGDLRKVEASLLVGVLLAGIGCTSWRDWRSRRRR